MSEGNREIMMAQEAAAQLQFPNRAPNLAATWTDEDKAALQETVAKGCNAAQFKVFVAACARLNLDPFARQIVPIVQGDKMTPQVTIDGFRLIADRTHKYLGQIGPFWCGEDGEWKEVWTAKGEPVACKIGVIRSDFAQPLYDVAHMRSYRKSTPTWNQLPIEMLAKVAEARALRRAFPQELSGVYAPEEMDQARVEQQEYEMPAARVVEQASTPARPAAASASRTRSATSAKGSPPLTPQGLRSRAATLGIVDGAWGKLWQEHGGNFEKVGAALDAIEATSYEAQNDDPQVTFTEVEPENGHDSLRELPVGSRWN